jgi:hypothetical protein
MLVAAGEAVATPSSTGIETVRRGIITLRATALVDQVQVIVADTGSWQPLHPDAGGTTVHLFARTT